jgi:hypothetical protein
VYETKPFIVRTIIMIYTNAVQISLFRTRRVRDHEFIQAAFKQGSRPDLAPIFRLGGEDGCRAGVQSTCYASHEPSS